MQHIKGGALMLPHSAPPKPGALHHGGVHMGVIPGA